MQKSIDHVLDHVLIKYMGIYRAGNTEQIREEKRRVKSDTVLPIS